MEEKEAEEGLEMKDGIITARDPENQSTHVTEKSPTSYVNIAFGQDSEEEEEGEEEGEGEMGVRGVVPSSGTDESAVKLSPQRYVCVYVGKSVLLCVRVITPVVGSQYANCFCFLSLYTYYYVVKNYVHLLWWSPIYRLCKHQELLC